MIRRLIAPLLVAVGLLAVVAAPAGAHVTVTSDGATQGGFAVITFRVPNEESDADTVGLKVQMPVDHPIAFVSVQPKTGWTVKATTSKLDKPLEAHGDQITEAVSEIEWTGGKFGPGEFEQFTIQAGPLPTDTDSLTFKAIQTYEHTDGSTEEVAWIQEAQPGEADPDHPAPVLALAPADGGDHASTPATGADDDASQVTVAATGDTAADTTTSKDAGSTQLNVFAMAFGAAGLIVAIAALVLAVAARQKMSMLARGQQPPTEE